MLHTARSAIFPNNALGPTRPIPTSEEQVIIKSICAEAILDLLPDKVQGVYFGGKSTMAEKVSGVGEVLDLFGDEYLNRHLMYGIVELLLVRLMPELAEKGVCELWEERLN